MRAFGITPYVVPADMERTSVVPPGAAAVRLRQEAAGDSAAEGDTIAVTDSDLSLEGGRHRFHGHKAASSMWRDPVYWDNVLGRT